MGSKVGSWGGSSAIRLPKAAIEKLGIREGEDVDLEIASGALVVRPAGPRYALADLLARLATLTIRGQPMIRYRFLWREEQ